MYGNASGTMSGTMSGNMSGTMSGTMSSTTSRKDEDEQDDNTLYDEAKIEWINLIFLPFHPIFQFVVLICVLHKVLLGPLDAVFGISRNCVYAMDISVYSKITKYFHQYPATIIYFIDTFLHIVHRQVADKAVRREHLPKSAFLIILDILALIPFEDLMSEDQCTIRLWPNILGFTEFLIVYRIVQYFELISTHACWKQYIGLTIFMFALLNFVACFLCLLTFHGLCSNCLSKTKQNKSVVYYDWRIFYDVAGKSSHHTEYLQMYFFSFVYLMSFTTGFTFDNSRPNTLIEHLIAIIFMYCAYILDHVVILPKLFAESVLSLRRICTFNPFIEKIIYEIQRRNPSPGAHASVRDFYDLIWKQRSGITCIPKMLKELPRYLRLDIREDLVWPVFYHSPTFRKTSIPFKRFICDSIRYDYKLPGEKLFAGPHCHSNMYYLKSGIVQFMSYDDGMTPILSVTAGTIFGDISFLSPPLKRKIIVKCLNYCEVLYVTRGDVLKALHRYPGDRKAVFDLAQDKIKHARDLYKCKQNIKGLDRAEDEGMDWLKRRWWEISDCVDLYRKRGRRLTDRCELPAEETSYHCAKYIGQLVLTTDVQLKQSSLFVNDEFPWILAPNSILYRIWQNFVIGVVIFVLVYFPPNISRKDVSTTFIRWKYFVDFVYISDICMSLLTAVNAEDATSNFASVMLVRFKKPAFVMDILASLWIEQITNMIDKPQYYYACLYNRLLKIYLLFPSEGSTWKLGQDTMFPIYTRVFFAYFSFVYLCAFLLVLLFRFFSDLSPFYFFGKFICEKPNQSERDCIQALHSLWVPWVFLYSFLYNDYLIATMTNILIKLLIAYIGHLIFMYLRSRFMAGMYLRYRDALSYQRFVTTLRGYYRHHEIHNDLMIRLERYLNCHWKYHQGVDVMRPNSLRDEPYDIFWKTQGEVAEKIIGESQLFIDADPAVVKDLAHIAKFLLMPKDSILAVLGVVCTNITWIVQGHVKIEYYDDAGQLQQRLYTAGHMVAATSSLLGKPSLRTYTVDTDCEIIYVSLNTFQKIMRRHPQEWENLNSCINEYISEFDELYYSYLRKNVDYHRKLRDRINTGRRYTVLPPPVQTQSPLVKTTRKKTKIIKVDTELYIKPDSGFMKYWMPFRAFTVLLEIVGSSLQGMYLVKRGAGAHFKWHLTLVNTLCTAISVVDIALKFFLAYYDERGILISTKLKTITNYLTRSFIMDVTGTLPWDSIVSVFLLGELPEGHAKVINTLSNFAHLYIIMGYFDYLADRPSSISAVIKIAKWQLAIILFTLAGSHFLINLCVRFTYDQDGALINMTRLESCWMPYYQTLPKNPPMNELHLIFAQSLNLAQSGLLNANHGEFQIAKKDQLLVAGTLLVLGAIYWYVMAYSLTLLVLVSRSNTLFEHGVHQLKSFLKSERIETDLINQTMSHFNYWRRRTNGINIQTLMFERVGVVFRQDLSFYFFKSTYLALDSLLEGGDQFQRQMASLSSQMYFLPNEEIMREWDIMPFIYVVHRGRVVIMQNDEKLAVLTKGSLFGQLTGRTPRPVKVTAIADSYTDVLKMSITEFNDALTSEIRATINSNQQTKNDFMATKKVFQENPRDTIKYLLRGRKTIKLPFMLGPKEAHTGNWYNRWLYVALLYVPAITVYFTALLSITPPRRNIELFRYLYIFLISDIFHIVHMVLEYYTLEVAIIGNRCVNRKVGWRLLKDWRLYANVVSLVVPILTYITGNWYYKAARFLRVSLFYDFYIHFCRRKSSWAPVIFKSLILILLMHSMVCGWIHYGCRRPLPIRPPPLTIAQSVFINRSTDFDEWTFPRVGRPNGCNKPSFYGHFVVPRWWYNDYKLAMSFIAQLHANVELGNASQMTIQEIYYKILISVTLYLVNIWMISIAIGYVYTKYRELYHYDYDVLNMSLYLRYSGLAPSLLRSVIEYTNHLWKRQRGNWMPELAMQAPACLKEDIFCALYLHHILTPPLFRKLPEYFTRQMVSRVKRTVIFPGKAIVQEGDIYAVMYFIHEGEIEKWYNYNSPEKKLASLLSTNGYFGFIPGLFPNTRFLFTYVSRTVVDLISLNLNDWQDLLHAYPEIKLQLYEGARQMKSEVKKEGQSIFPV